MRPNWPVVELGKHLRVKHGLAFKGEYFGDAGEFIVLTPGNFYDEGGFKPKDGAEKFYTAEPPADYVLRRNDLVVAMTEQVQGLLGSSALVPCDDLYLHNQRIGLVELQPDVDRRFIYYLFNTHWVRDQIQATATGSKVRHTAPSRIEAVTVSLPPLTIQRKIASILSAYDDLIENNRRRIELLEEMARRLYHEWLVDFRFPVHESVPHVESDLGPVPEGWMWTPLFEAADVTFGFPFKSRLFNSRGEGVPVVRIRDLPGNSTETFTTEVPTGDYVVSDGDVLIGMDGDFHMCVWAAGESLLNQRVCRVRPKVDYLGRYGLSSPSESRSPIGIAPSPEPLSLTSARDTWI